MMMNSTLILEEMEIKDNTFARQFETMVDGKMISVEYSFQEKKIFLTRINTFDGFDNEEFINEYLKNILQIAEERKLKVVPVFPRIASFFRKNPKYKELLPPGIKI
jgi:hypothetical protein